MSHVRLYVHTVWSTKDRLPTMAGKARLNLLKHIREYARSKNILVDHINGGEDHLHALISMNADQSISGIMNLIKGESAHWINKMFPDGKRFSWQRQFWAVSVGISQLKPVRDYIRDQEAHHHVRTFKEEKDEFIIEYGLEEFEDESMS